MTNKMRFDQVMCCALAQGFARHPQMIAGWSEVVGRVKLYADVLLRTLSLEFTPNAEIASVHRAFAQAERERLATCGHEHGLRCEHTAAQHLNALDAILKQLPPVH